MRLLPLLALALFSLLSTAPSSSGASAATRTTVSGGALAHPVQFSAADDDAFVRRVNFPPVLDETPATSGKAYTLTSAYWDIVLRVINKDKGEVDGDALYYPEGGLVKARQGGGDVWLTLDLRQRAIIGRYIRLGQANLVGPEPGVLEVLQAASASEPLVVDVAGKTLDPSAASRFWAALQGLRSTSLTPTQPPAATDDGLWLIFNLPEARAVQLFYNRRAQTLTDYLGVERYKVTPALAQIIETNGAAGAVQVPQEPGTGSPAWWVIMIGVGLASITAAVLIQRRFAGVRG